jgi:hypothetical protein
MIVLNAVDDQFYFATSQELKKWFEPATQAGFDIAMLGQATWFLQSGITQFVDYSTILDQSRFAALVTARYLPPLDNDRISPCWKAVSACPLPALPVLTKNDCSQNYAAIMKLPEECNFDHAAAIGSLIWLINTFVKLSFRKLAKYMRYPGRQHFVYLHHLPNHIQFYRHCGGTNFTVKSGCRPNTSWWLIAETSRLLIPRSSSSQTRRFNKVKWWIDVTKQDSQSEARLLNALNSVSINAVVG